MLRTLSSTSTPASPQPVVNFSNRKIHLIGIGGCGMSGIASMLLKHRAKVSGSDAAASEVLQVLRGCGATVHVGHDHRHLPGDVDLVVASAAIPQDNPELLAARACSRPVLKYAELLGALMRHTVGVAIAGTHGKSTATAMTAFAAREVGLDPSFIVGAEVPQLRGGSGVGKGDGFIVEACEYDRSFLKLAPTCAAILNIEEDHLDYYRDLDDILSAFEAFAELLPSSGMLLINHDDPPCRRVARRCAASISSIGLQPGADWRATDVRVVDGLPAFSAWRQDVEVGRVTLSVPGTHNIYNALAAWALACRLGAEPAAALAAAGRFTGAARRLTCRGRHADIDLLDDYAHHPTEIKATLEAVRQRYGRRRLWVVFQPHQVSRTRFFLDDFANSFMQADEIIVPDIYFVRDLESDLQVVSSRDLVQRISNRGGRASYIPRLSDIAETLAERVRPDDVVLTMGAGDVWKVADEMVSRLRGRC